MRSRDVDWVPPDSFDEYRLVQALGRGSMGQVWLAHDTVLDRLVAVKFVARLPAHDTVRRRFLTEARAAARVQHPNIVVAYRVGEIGPIPYLVSEYVRGDSLDKLTRPVAWPQLLEIARGLAGGLAAAHRRGVLHRDLKPANAIVSETCQVKLLDFGLAKLLPHDVPPNADALPGRETATPPDAPGEPMVGPRMSSESFMLPSDKNASTVELPDGAPARVSAGGIALPEVTGTGVVMGTPGYMSPEVWRGEPATPRSDVYSLGALLYMLGADALPHPGATLESMRESVLAGAPVPLTSAAPAIDARFAAVVDRCLRRDPAERFASGDEVLAALEMLAASGSAAGPVLARPSQERSPPRTRWAILVGAMLAPALALLAYGRAAGQHAHPLVDTASDVQVQRAPAAPMRTAGSHLTGAVPGRCPEGMVPVPAGTFQMGSPEGQGDPDEQPQHAVTLSAYCIDETEVTVTAYAACVAAGACSPALLTVNRPMYSAMDVKFFSQLCNRADRPDHPMNCVDWDQAGAYCAWQGKRLPTEAEWEYAARGDDGRTYPWGNQAPGARRLNMCGSECQRMWLRMSTRDHHARFDGDDGWESSAPVGSYPEGRSPFGALDMAGNVWEWTADWYGSYASHGASNPQGPRTGTSRVYRGGGWASQSANKGRAADRSWVAPVTRDCDLGFRCARGG